MATNGNGSPQYVGGTPQYDSNGIVTNQVTTSRTEQYGYDANNRLTSVDYGDGGTQGYAFDALGNRLSKTDSAAGGSSSTTTYGYNAANMLLGTALNGGSVSAYTNDADGNTLTGGGRVNTWDSQNRLVQSIVNGTASTFKYGADGLRRQMTVTPAGGGTATTTDYCLDGQSVVREMQRNSQGVLTPTATYFAGPRGPEYKRSDLDGTVRWYVYDGLGSVVGEVDPNGNLTASTGYDVYGAKRGGVGASASRHGFVGSLGHQTDAETGLVYMRARYYDPQVGRFVSEDMERDGNNWLVYCADNPVNAVDSSGEKIHWENDAWAVAGAACTGLAIGLVIAGVACRGASFGTGDADAIGCFKLAECAALAAVVCFKNGMEGLQMTGGIRGKLEAWGLLCGVVAVMLGGVREGTKLNIPAMTVVMEAVFGYGLACLGTMAAEDDD